MSDSLNPQALIIASNQGGIELKIFDFNIAPFHPLRLASRELLGSMMASRRIIQQLIATPTQLRIRPLLSRGSTRSVVIGNFKRGFHQKRTAVVTGSSRGMSVTPTAHSHVSVYQS